MRRVRSRLTAKPQTVELAETERDDHEVDVFAARLGKSLARLIDLDDIMIWRQRVDEALERASLVDRRAGCVLVPGPAAPGLQRGRSHPLPALCAARLRNSSIENLSRASDRTRAISAISSTGLVRKSSAPASRPRTRSAGRSSAVTRMIGRWAVSGAALNRRQTSKPSMPGIITSRRTMIAAAHFADRNCIGAIRRRQHLEIFDAEPRLEELTVGLDVVNHQDASRHCFVPGPRN